MKTVPTYQKLRGGYYTPKPIADFLADWAIKSPRASVMDPSCGDGEMLTAAAETLERLGAEPSEVANLVHGAELDPREALKAADRMHGMGVAPPSDKIHTGDFFSLCEDRLLEEKLLDVVISEGEFFDAIVGNPPFIRYQNFPEEHRDKALAIMRSIGLKPNRLTNSWVPFIVASTLLLRERGRIAMVVPAELLQVNYAAELRLFLSEQYGEITLVTFKRLLFHGVQQEVVLLLGERDSSKHTEIRTVELESTEDLLSYEHAEFSAEALKPMNHTTEKWTQYFLDHEEIELLRSLRSNAALTVSGEVIDVDVGIVTGLNKFFVLTEQQTRERSLEPYTRRIVGRSGNLKGLVFSEEDWMDTAQRQSPAFLFSPPDTPPEQLPDSVREYIASGVEEGANEGYKCRIRKRWFIVPSAWTPQAFMLRQIHGYPKIVLNEADATCTDTIHRVKFRGDRDGREVAAAFLNSATFAFAEVMGRSYGGGVLELEPNEAEKLYVPLCNSEKLDVAHIHELLLQGDIESILDITDKTLLVDGLGLTFEEAKLLRGMWRKLRDRRINRRRKG
ncbi:MAG: class I SAM-dependent methyltransferase [Actinomycetota bacterium]|jgi:adenine-specific DNA-methyltransferase|nr:class I SAM-dependent methyltransferase [Actinomycetota bacterium]